MSIWGRGTKTKAELKREEIDTEISETTEKIRRLEKKMLDPGYIRNACQDIVRQDKDSIEGARRELASLKKKRSELEFRK